MTLKFIDPAELELRRNRDFLDSLTMVDEGAPVTDSLYECKLTVRQLQAIEQTKGYEEIPRECR